MSPGSIRASEKGAARFDRSPWRDKGFTLCGGSGYDNQIKDEGGGGIVQGLLGSKT